MEEDKEFIKKYIQKYGGEEKELLYELRFMVKKNILSQRMSFGHEKFDEVSKRLHEMDHFMDNPFKVVEGSERCCKCGSNRTILYSKQTRSSDEGATVFCRCVECGHRAIYNS